MAKKAKKKTPVSDAAPRKRGRPPFIETPEEFDAEVERYVAECELKGEPLTKSGLAYFLGYADRSGLDEAAKRDGFSLSVKRALLLVESSYEKRLTGPNAAGPIFALKNFGWKDKQEMEASGGISVRWAKPGEDSHAE